METGVERETEKLRRSFVFSVDYKYPTLNGKTANQQVDIFDLLTIKYNLVPSVFGFSM